MSAGKRKYQGQLPSGGREHARPESNPWKGMSAASYPSWVITPVHLWLRQEEGHEFQASQFHDKTLPLPLQRDLFYPGATSWPQHIQERYQGVGKFKKSSEYTQNYWSSEVARNELEETKGMIKHQDFWNWLDWFIVPEWYNLESDWEWASEIR